MSYPILFQANERHNVPAIAGIAVAGLSHVDDETENSAPFGTQGIGTLSDTISCTVTEERNGLYELTMQYPISGVHFADIVQRAFILARPNYTDDPQPFRIYKITKPLNGICTIYAQHISYDLSGYEMPKGLSAVNLTAAVRLLSEYSGIFNIKTTKTGTAGFKTDVPSSVRSWLGGKEGSLLDLYGGEWHWNGYDCTLSTARGENRGVTIRYGKNLTTLQQDEECSNLYSTVRAYISDGNGNTINGNLVSTGISLGTARTLFLDAGGQFEGTPTVAQLTAYAQQYIWNNNLTVPKVNLTLDFVQMQSLAERVDLCDTVTIQFEQLGVSAQAKCIKTVWDVLKERYTQTVFGDAQSSFASTMATVVSDTQAQIRDTKSTLEKSIDRATSLITGNSGGYVVFHDGDGDGKPDEILIMDTPSIDTAVKVWRWNQNGLGYSSTGYDGNFALAMTADGQIVADFITTGTLDADAVQVINLDASNITTGTMTADHISGGTLQLGGSGNADGTIAVYDASGNLVASLDKDGLVANAGTFTGEVNATSGTIDSITATNIAVQSGYIDITTSSMADNKIRLVYTDSNNRVYVNTVSPYTFQSKYTVENRVSNSIMQAGLLTVNSMTGNTQNSYATLNNSGTIQLYDGTKLMTITPDCNVATLQYTVVSTF